MRHLTTQRTPRQVLQPVSAGVADPAQWKVAGPRCLGGVSTDPGPAAVR